MRELQTTVHTVLLLALTVFLWVGTAQAVPPSTPLEIQFIQRELVVIGSVTEVGDAVTRTLSLPGEGKVATGRFRKFGVEVAEVFKDAGRAIETGQKDGQNPTIEVWATSTEPGPTRFGSFHPNLTKGMSYVLFLQAMQDKGAFFLPSDMAACEPVTENLVATVRKIADIPKWPWGAEQDGLRLALLGPDGPQKTLPAGYTRKGANVVVGFLIAVQNTSADSVALELDSAKKPLTLAATGPNGESITYDIYQDIEGQPLKPNRSTVSVEAGRVAFLGPTGFGVRRISCFLSLSQGKWKFRLACSVKESNDSTTRPTWRGTVQSAPVAVEVER